MKIKLTKKGQAEAWPSREPADLLAEATLLNDKDSAEWFEHHVAVWAKHSGFSLESTRGVFSRWLYYFGLQNGIGPKIQNRFGKHFAAA
jgi:hypothetical protein